MNTDKMNIDLTGRKALVCGASQGIGGAIARSLASCGAKIVLVARNTSKLESQRNGLSGVGHTCYKADLAESDDLDRLCEFLKGEHVDIVINNTGGPAPGPITAAPMENFQKALQMHLAASHQIMQAVLPHMKSTGYGRFVNIISTSVKIPIPGLGVSNTVRGAMASWAKTLSNEVAEYGITVNNILPGLVRTSRLSGLIDNLSKEQGIPQEQVESNLKKTIPAGRFGEPEELGNLAAFLVSDYAHYITGVSIPVDGGKTGSL